jgi:asparagine synthase (glutamine-hydrolysing)
MRLPLKHRLRRNVINATTAALDDRLATIPHASSGVPLTRSFPVDVLWNYANQACRRLQPSDEPPASHLTHAPWGDTDGLVRSQPFVERTLHERVEAIDSLPFFDLDGVNQCYRRHLNGANNSFELLTLLSFLRMPVVDDVTADVPVRASS